MPERQELSHELRIGFDLGQGAFFDDFKHGARAAGHRLGFVGKRRHKRGIRFDLFKTSLGQILSEILGNVSNGFNFGFDCWNRFYGSSVACCSLNGRNFGNNLRCFFESSANFTSPSIL